MIKSDESVIKSSFFGTITSPFINVTQHRLFTYIQSSKAYNGLMFSGNINGYYIQYHW